jgi:hypothetical protein
MLKENIGLVYMDLRHNPNIGDQGAQYFVEVLDEMDNGSLFQLRMAGCEL